LGPINGLNILEGIFKASGGVIARANIQDSPQTLFLKKNGWQIIDLLTPKEQTRSSFVPLHLLHSAF
jgi:hypothetical protein